MSEDTQKFFENPEAEELLEKAANLFSANKVEAAETVLRQITQRFPDFFPGFAAYGDFLLNVGRPDLALSPLRKAVRLAIFEGMGHYLLGVAYLKVARFNLAERELESAEKLLQNKSDVRAHLGRAKVMLRKIADGRKLIAEALKDDPENPFIRTDMAQSYVVEKNFEEALRCFEGIRSEDPFFKENADVIRKFKEDFERLAPEDQETARRESLNKERGNKMRIEMLLGIADSGGGLAEEDIAEITEELRLYGLTGQITVVKDENDPKSKAAMEFIKMHEELGLGMGERREKLSLEKICVLEEIIAEGKSTEEKKKAIVLLASSGAPEALEALVRFGKNPQPEDLKLWAELAYDECRLINSGVSKNEPSVAFRNLS